MVFKSQRSKDCDIQEDVKWKVWERDHQCCVVCGNPKAFPNAHFVSRAHGGLGIEQNIVTLCFKHHEQFDFGDEFSSNKVKRQIELHLKNCYEDWNINDLIYSKNNLTD